PTPGWPGSRESTRPCSASISSAGPWPTTPHCSACSMRLSDRQTEHALTVLTRLAQREPNHTGALAAAVRRGLPGSLPPAMRVATTTGQPMAEVLTALARELDADQLALVRKLLPDASTALRFLTDTVLDRLLAFGAAAEPADVAERIELLTHRAESLIEIGAPRQALPIAQQAIDLAALDDESI